jgi:NTP pyrophosphatase (non-canonical NTP hydrolase)
MPDKNALDPVALDMAVKSVRHLLRALIDYERDVTARKVATNVIETYFTHLASVKPPAETVDEDVLLIAEALSDCLEWGMLSWTRDDPRAVKARKALDLIARLSRAGQSVPSGWTMADLRAANTARQVEWFKGGDQKSDLAYRGNELAGEVGEACNVIKKLERERHGWRGSRATVADLADELADVVICVDLIGESTGIDLQAAVARKFNATSEKYGLATKLPTPPAHKNEP